MVIGFEEKFIQPLPAEAAAALKTHVKATGMYFYPNEQDPAKLAEVTATNPYGLVTFSTGSPFSFGAALGTQFVLYLVCALIAAWLYAKAMPNLRGTVDRIVFVALFGVFAVILVTGGYANWYRFPWGLVAVDVLDQGIGWALAGFVFTKLIR